MAFSVHNHVAVLQYFLNTKKNMKWKVMGEKFKTWNLIDFLNANIFKSIKFIEIAMKNKQIK